MYIYSRAVHTTIQSTGVDSKLNVECRNTLNSLAENRAVELLWVPDRQLWPRTADRGKMMQTTQVPYRRRTPKELLQLNMQEAKRVVSLITEHAQVNYHKYKRGRADSQDWGFCGTEEETARHFCD